jgi:preprotein translocase subunit SecA
VYGLPVVRIAPHRPSQRRRRPARLYADAAARWQAVIASIAARRASDQAVLVGTRSIRASEHLSALLGEAGIAHRVLNAKQDGEEAALIAAAGGSGVVTIATNMAGRGSDIKPDAAVIAAGGLHVIVTERHDNRRVDRQLVGRCARQGDPGTWETLLSLDDELVAHFVPSANRALRAALRRAPRSRLLQALGLAYYRCAQWRTERAHRAMRFALLRADFQTRRSLSFGGQME